MLTNWGEHRLEDCLDALIDYRGKSPTKSDFGIPLITAKVVKNGRIEPPNEFIAEADYDDWMSRGFPRLGDVLLTTEAPLGEVAQVSDERVALAQRLICMRGKADVLDNRFLKYSLLTGVLREQLLSRATGTTVTGIRQSELRRLLVPLPTITEQRAIAHILGTLDDKIELNRQKSETLGAMARSLFKSWFIDFDPVAQKKRGIWRKGESLPGLPAHLYDLFPDRLVEPELGEIPEGWRWATAIELIAFNPPEPLRKGTIAPYLDMAALPTSGSWPDAAIDREFGSGMRFRNGDALLARITPCLENGKTAFVQSLPDDVVAWGSTEFIVMRSRAPVPPSYSYLLARSPAFREHTIRSMTGTSGRQRAQAAAVADFRVASPDSDAVWSVFGDFVEPLFKQIREVSIESESLAKLRDTLLPKLISGELRVNDAERFAEGVVSGFGRQSAC